MAPMAHLFFNLFRRVDAYQYLPLSTAKKSRRGIYVAVLLISIVSVIATLYWARQTQPLEVLTRQSPNAPALGPDPMPLYLPPMLDFHLPEVAHYNTPPVDRPRTPLFIGFTRNRFMLQQTVLSYIAAGWPRSDIIVVDNSGTLDANEMGLLTGDNPFHLDYHLLRSRYGVSIFQTPTLLNFAQLQNFFLRTALSEKWDYYFWSHMDVGILSYEDQMPYRSFYARVLEILHSTGITTGTKGNWAVKFFNFDHLALVNVRVWRDIGQWDTFIPYYATDCDAYSRARLRGFDIDDVTAGYIFDVAAPVDDPESKFFPPSPSAVEAVEHKIQQKNSSQYQSLLSELQALQIAKSSDGAGRNTWQDQQRDGKGQPWTYDPAAFQIAWWDTAEFGRAAMYKKKWKTRDCDLVAAGKTMMDMWSR